MLARETAKRLQAKPCGEVSCPLQMRDMWAAAHLAIMRWDEFMEHPTDPDLRAKVGERMEVLRAAAKNAEPVMEVRLKKPDVAIRAVA